MTGRIVWLVLIAAIATVTAGVQLDREARYHPSIAGAVPEPFRAFAQEHRVAQAARSGNSEETLAQAAKLVARRPMPASHLRSLSAAQIEAGQLEEAAVSIQLAARRGWRDQPTQKAMLELALAAGDETEAARRFAALFVRRANGADFLKPLAARVFAPANDTARSEFARIVAGAERWHPIFLRKAPAALPPEALADICARLELQPTELRCR